MAILGIKQTVALQGITPEPFKAEALAAVPIKRFLDPGEVANLVWYVASKQAKGITGQAINICSGQTTSRGVLTTGAIASIYTAFVRHGLHKARFSAAKLLRGLSRE